LHLILILILSFDPGSSPVALTRYKIRAAVLQSNHFTTISQLGTPPAGTIRILILLQVLEFEILSRRLKLLPDVAAQRGASPRGSTVRFFCVIGR
jgi:hypothetical protein